ncbi:MAG: DUF4831 family protein [Paludibacteraceae bacterium]|nr:DUF4831 family protein [Paludibacteraceae bacterium]
MRNLVLILSIFLMLSRINAQEATTVVAGQSQLIYSLPMTELVFELEIEKTTQTPGPYYQYAERYLATSQVLIDEKTTYKLKSTNLKTNALPDPRKLFAVAAGKSQALQHISVNEKGLLTGINCRPESARENEIRKVRKTKQIQSVSRVLPLTEEYLMAGSTARLAEGAAKQIYRIRESRISLLTGDLEHMPTDGASIKTMLKELDRMENELTELFTGHTHTEIVRHAIRYTPLQAADKMLIFRLSALKGLVDINDLSGVPYFLSILPETINVQPANPKAKSQKVAVYTILPAPTVINLTDGVNTLISRNIAMPQFGLTIGLTENMFKHPDTKLSIDPETGRLLFISTK